MVVFRFCEDERGKLKNLASSSATTSNRDGPEAAGEEDVGMDRIGFFFFFSKKFSRQTGQRTGTLPGRSIAKRSSLDAVDGEPWRDFTQWSRNG